MWLSFSCHKEYTVRSCSISCPLLCFRHTHLIPRGTAFHSDAFSLICGYRQPCRAENKSVSRRVICGQEKKYKNHRRWVTDFIPPASSQAHALVAVSALQVQFFKLFACPAEFLYPSQQESLGWKDIRMSSLICVFLKSNEWILQ